MSSQQQKQSQTKTERNFLEVHPEALREIYLFYKHALATSSTPPEKAPIDDESIIETISSDIINKYNIPHASALALASLAISRFSSPDFQESIIGEYSVSSKTPSPTDPATLKLSYTPEEILITSEDYKRFVEAISPDESHQIKTLLLSFIVFYRRNFHPTGWIRYDKKNIFYLAGILKASSKLQESLTSYLHTHYGLDMKVVGSNQPIPCYSFSWLQQQPPPGSDTNPMISLGPLTPDNLIKVATKTISPTPPTA